MDYWLLLLVAAAVGVAVCVWLLMPPDSDPFAPRYRKDDADDE